MGQNRASRSKFYREQNRSQEKPLSVMDYIAIGIGLVVVGVALCVIYRNSGEFKKFASYLDVKLDDLKESNTPISEMEKPELMDLLIKVTAEKNFYDAEILQKIINAK